MTRLLCLGFRGFQKPGVLESCCGGIPISGYPEIGCPRTCEEHTVFSKGYSDTPVLLPLLTIYSVTTFMALTHLPRNLRKLKRNFEDHSLFQTGLFMHVYICIYVDIIGGYLLVWGSVVLSVIVLLLPALILPPTP